MFRYTDALLDLFDKHNIVDTIVINRRNVAQKRCGIF